LETTQIDMKNQLMAGLLSSLGYSSPSSNNNGYMSGGYNTQSPETSGSMANAGNFSTSWGSDLYNTGAQRLTDTYNKAVQANINDANRRGLFGSI
jgi:hypothetical protein